METYEIPIPVELRDAVSDDTPAAITEFLALRGVAVTSVSIRVTPDGVPLWLIVESATDPRPALAEFSPADHSADKELLRAGIAVLDGYAAAIEEGQTRTLAQTTQTLRVLIRVLFRVLEDDPRIRDLVR